MYYLNVLRRKTRVIELTECIEYKTRMAKWNYEREGDGLQKEERDLLT